MSVPLVKQYILCFTNQNISTSGQMLEGPGKHGPFSFHTKCCCLLTSCSALLTNCDIYMSKVVRFVWTGSRYLLMLTYHSDHECLNVLLSEMVTPDWVFVLDPGRGHTHSYSPDQGRPRVGHHTEGPLLTTGQGQGKVRGQG